MSVFTQRYLPMFSLTTLALILSKMLLLVIEEQLSKLCLKKSITQVFLSSSESIANGFTEITCNKL